MDISRGKCESFSELPNELEPTQEMENYENLSFTFKEMLKRMKTMRVRLRDLGRTINKNNSELFNEQYGEMQSECDAIGAGIGYLNIEIKRTIIMLKNLFV